LCAFAINDDKADTLSSIPRFSKFLDPPLDSPVRASADFSCAWLSMHMTSPTLALRRRQALSIGRVDCGMVMGLSLCN